MHHNIFPNENEIPQNYRMNPVHQREYLSNGKIKTWNGPQQEVKSPICIRNEDESITQKIIGSYPLLDKEESMRILDAAVNAYDGGRGIWPTMGVKERIAHVEKFVSSIRNSRDLVINTLMWEIGKSYNDSAKEFDRTVQYIKDTVKALKDMNNKSTTIMNEEGVMAQIRRSPFGVTLCMGPFNYPLNETYTTLIPAIIMGNTIVLKPAKYGVLLHQHLLKAYQESFPLGVINTVYGDGATTIGPMMESGKIDVLAFIGSSKVADILQKQHPNPHHLESILGLDAKNPAIILPDADLELTVNECVQGSLSFNGQRCTGLKMLFVHEQIKDEFTQLYAKKVEALKKGMPWTEGVTITPLPEQGKTDYLNGLKEDAISKGGILVTGGRVIGTLFEPAVITNVNNTMRIYHEEQFGPIVPILKFQDIKEPLDYVTQSPYGQQVSIFGKDALVISQLIDTLANQVSRININSQCQRGPDVYPFTGRKRSAKKTLSVSDALRAFSIRSMVAVKETNKSVFEEILSTQVSSFLTTDQIL